MWREYLFPRSIDEALDILSEHKGKARIIAGGTDLILQRKQGTCPSDVAVDITRIPGLDRITVSGSHISLGALVTHAQVAASPLIRERAPLLAEACSKVGGPQTRNMGTLVGNVTNAMPAADGAIALTVLNAEALVHNQEGGHWMPIQDLYLGVGECRIDACAEIVTALQIQPLGPSWGSAYERLAKRQSLILPILAVAAAIRLDAGRCLEARIAMGPVAPAPHRARAAEEYLQGRPVAETTIKKAAEAAKDEARPRDSVLRGSQEYRQEMVEVLSRRAITRAAILAGYRFG
jgi:carbon-monoxide dehydrogenase medium subunit